MPSMRGQLETAIGNTELTIPYSLEGPSIPTTETTIVYMHGLACSGEDFAGAAEDHTLAQYQRLALTYPGCDGTPYPADAQLHLDNLVEVTHDVVSVLGLHNLVLVGHDIGGIIALRYADKYPPHDVKGVVSVEGNLHPSDCFLTSQIMVGAEDRESLRRRFAASDNPGFRHYATQLERTNPRALQDYAGSAVEQTDRGDLFDRFTRFLGTTSTLFMCGSSNVQSIGYLDELENAGIDTVVIPDSGHFPHIDNPTSYFRALGEFMATL
jgi:pimeloyl-ACP methyl ester carboxylesterase